MLKEMKTNIKKHICVMSVLLVAVPSLTAQQQNFPKLTGPYLGQKPPGLTPELFAPGIITTPFNEAYPSFTKTGKEFYFHCNDKGGWLFTHVVGDQWSNPQIIPFSDEYKFGEAMVTPDGKIILFCTRYDPGNLNSSQKLDLWWMEKKNGKWQKPKKFGSKINTIYHEAYPSFAPSGDLYFFRDLENENEGCEIFVSRYQNGEFLPPENLGSAVNSSQHDCDPFISPNEKYLLFCVRDQADGFGNNDLYVSFKKSDGSWSKSINMGSTFNTKAEEITPYVTPDGKYIFFSSNRTGNYDIYWVDAKIIEKLRPNH